MTKARNKRIQKDLTFTNKQKKTKNKKNKKSKDCEIIIKVNKKQLTDLRNKDIIIKKRRGLRLMKIDYG
jgi:hypothetical protein